MWSPASQHEHLMSALFYWANSQYFKFRSRFDRRDRAASDAAGCKGKTQRVFEIGIPCQRLLLGTRCSGENYPLDTLFPCIIFGLTNHVSPPLLAEESLPVHGLWSCVHLTSSIPESDQRVR